MRTIALICQMLAKISPFTHSNSLMLFTGTPSAVTVILPISFRL